jgi:FkbM family methyltransferase
MRFGKILFDLAYKAGYTLAKKDPAQSFSKISFSQCGEDLLVNYVFFLRGIQYPTYIDIGAFHPFSLSNTALFYRKGCRGINIDANPFLLEQFKMHRPQDINLNLGIGPSEGNLEFYIMENPSLSTFSEREAAQLINSGNSLKEKRKVRILTIDQVLSLYFNSEFPDFMNIDVEGLDFEILNSLKLKSVFPKVICVEASDYSSSGNGRRREEIIELLNSKEYFEFANTNLNAIMVRKEFWFQ